MKKLTKIGRNANLDVEAAKAISETSMLKRKNRILEGKSAKMRQVR